VSKKNKNNKPVYQDRLSHDDGIAKTGGNPRARAAYE